MVTGVANLMPILDGVEGESFTTEEYIHLYTMMYDMLTQKSPMNQSQQFYDRYKASLDEYLKSTVLPSLKDRHSECLLRELVQRWRNHKLMVRWLSRFFHYLVHYYISQKSLRPLTQPGWSCFHDLVFVELKNTVTTIVVGMVDDEREGQLIDRSLLKNVLDIYVEIGFGDLGLYEVDFEQAFLKGTTDYYSKKAQTWILEDSCPEYMLNAEECLQDEKERLTH